MKLALPTTGSRTSRARTIVAVLATAMVSTGLLPGTHGPAQALEPVATGYPVGDFESGTVPEGWSVTAAAPSRAVVSTGVAFSGKRALFVEDTSSTSAVTARRKFAVVGGVEYHAQAYVFTKSGLQSLGLKFYDASGRVVGSASTPTTGARMIWSRVETRAVAPSTATTASIDIATSSATLSQAWWDGVGVIRPDLPNGGFEATSTSVSVPGWTVSAPSGTSAVISTAQARTGRRSLLLTDASSTAGVSATSSAVPVFPGVTHSLRVWVRPTSGAFVATVRFLDAARHVVRSERVDIRKGLLAWGLVTKQLTAPSTALTATVEISSASTSRGAAAFDTIDLRPAIGAGVHTFAAGASTRPVDAFSNTNVVDGMVVNGRAKLMAVVSGSPAEFQVVDIETGRVDSRFPLGGMKISFAITKGRDGRVYIGGNDGHLWQWTPGATVIKDLGRATAKATTVWDVEVAGDGKIWGVTYPASELWSYDPSAGTLRNYGTLSAAHQYARSLALDSRYAWVGLGSENPVIMRVTLANPTERVLVALPKPVVAGNIADIESLGRYLEVWTPAGRTPGGATVTSERRLYDTTLKSWNVSSNLAMQRPSTLDSRGYFYYFRYKELWAVSSADGTMTSRGKIVSGPGRDRFPLKATLGGVAGEWLLTYDTDGTVAAVNLGTLSERSYTVKFAATKMRIKSLGTGSSTLYVGGYGGSSLAVLDPDMTSRQQYPRVPFAAGVIGEVEGTINHGAYQYLGTYTGGQIFRFDTTKPWVDGSNPKMVASLGGSYQQDRPLAWATSGSRVFFGTIPKYGILSGAMGIFDSDSTTPRIVNAPVKDQSVVALAASGRVVYGGTSRWGGLGATPTQASAKVFAWDATTNKKLWEVAPVPGAQAFGAVTIGPQGSLWAAYGSAVVELDPATGAVKRQVVLQPATASTSSAAVLRNADLAWVGGLLYLTSGGKVYTFDPATLRVDVPVESGVSTPQMVVQPGRFYVPFETTLREYVVR